MPLLLIIGALAIGGLALWASSLNDKRIAVLGSRGVGKPLYCTF